MDKASKKIKDILNKYSSLISNVEKMKSALDKVDLDGFHIAHERMLASLEGVEFLMEENEEESEVSASGAELKVAVNSNVIQLRPKQ